MDFKLSGDRNVNQNANLKRLQQKLTQKQPETANAPKQPAPKIKGNEKDCAPVLECENILEEINLTPPHNNVQPQNKIVKKLSPGLNTFEYGNARLDLFKRNNVILKQMVTPQNFDKKKFTDTFPDLKEFIDTTPEPVINENETETTNNITQEEITPVIDRETQNPVIEENDFVIDTNNIFENETETTSEVQTVENTVEVQDKTEISKPSQTNPSVATINGEIDETVIQGSTGDCWIISALLSLNSSSVGKELIKNSITVNDDSSVTVNFKGLGVSYTIDASEISKYDTDNITSDSYSNGDNDMLVFELAAEKLRKDIKSGRVKINSSNTNITYAGDGKGIDDGGLPVQMLYYLTGVESEEVYNKNLSNLSSDKINKMLDNADESTVLSFVVYGNGHSAKLIDGSSYSLSLKGEGHALAITNVTDDTVTFVNPWDSGISYTMTRSEFAKLGICYMCSTDLDKADLKEETSDMSQNADNEKKVSIGNKPNIFRNFMRR